VNRSLIPVMSAALLLSACMRLPTTKSSRTSTSNDRGSSAVSDQSAANGSSYAANAAKVTDACTLMPPELVKKIVPAANAPQSEQYPRRCSVSNGTSVLEITIETGIIIPVDPINGAEFVPGLAEGGYLERLDPYAKGDIYLTVILGKDPKGLLHVEVAGHDGKDHEQDAIAVARDILDHLQSPA
jgi:hypothetical protein